MNRKDKITNYLKSRTNEGALHWATHYLSEEEIDKLLENPKNEIYKESLTRWKCENFICQNKTTLPERKK